MAEIVIKVQTEGGEKTLKSIQDIKDTLKQLETEASNLDLGSEAYQESISQIEALKKKLQELGKTREQLAAEEAARQDKAAADAKKTAEALEKAEQDRINAAENATRQQAERAERLGNNVQKFAAGLTDAFAGAFIAFGATGEDAEKFNKTLQQGVGIALGVKGGIEALVAGVELAGPAFEAFNAIIAANPIGATVVILAALTAGIYALATALSKEDLESEKLTKSLEKQKTAAELLKVANANEVSILEAKAGLLAAQGASDETQLAANTKLYEAKRKGLQQDLVQLELAANISKAKLAEEIANTTLTESYYELSIAFYRKTKQDQQADNLQKVLDKSRKDRQQEATDQLGKDLQAVSNLRTAINALDIKQEGDLAAASLKRGEDQKKLQLELLDGRKKELADQKIAYDKQVNLAHGNAVLLQQVEDNNRLAISNINFKYDKLEKEQREAAIKQQEIDEEEASDYLASIDDANFVKKEDKLEKEVEANKAAQAAILSASLDRYADELKAEAEAQAKRKKLAEDVNQVTQAYATATNQILSSIDAYQQAEADRRVKNLENNLNNEVSILESSKNNELKVLEQANNYQLANEDLTAEQRADITFKYNAKKKQIEEQAAQKEYELQLATYNRETVIKKKAFETDKKLKIATAIIQTASGILAAVSGLIGTNPTPVGIATAIAAGVAVAALGAIQIATISNTQFEAGQAPVAPTFAIDPTASYNGGGGDSSGTSVNNRPVNGPNLYGINGDVDANNINRRNNVNQPIQAYVVTEDMTYSQNLNAVIQRRASF